MGLDDRSEDKCIVSFFLSFAMLSLGVRSPEEDEGEIIFSCLG